MESEEVQKRCLMYVEGSLIPIELGLNLEANFKFFVPWKLKSAAPNELKTS